VNLREKDRPPVPQAGPATGVSGESELAAAYTARQPAIVERPGKFLKRLIGKVF